MSVKIKELPLSERPYEKLKMYGAQTLSNSELLAIIIKSGTKEETSVGLAQKVLSLGHKMNIEKKGLNVLQDISFNELVKIKGIGEVKAIQILAVCELVKRMTKPIDIQSKRINNSSDVAELFIEELKYEKREKVKALILDSKNRIIKIVDISLGGTNFSIIEPKHVLVDAVKLQAPKIILIHNHPSGDPTPSEGDIFITDRIKEAADIIGIELLDHIIIGLDRYESVLSKNRKKKG